jgi:hypothetical protein
MGLFVPEPNLHIRFSSFVSLREFLMVLPNKTYGTKNKANTQANSATHGSTHFHFIKR